VRAWAERQTLTRDRYELILLAPGFQPELEREARSFAGPHDQWIERPGANEWELFNVGAEAARGRYVFLTEAHCIAEPECLAAMLTHLERTGGPGTRGASIGVSSSRLGELERIVYEEDLRVGEQADHWSKVLIHSLAIRRDAYLNVRGFDVQLSDFAPWALSIALREHGYRLDYTPAPRVRHRYTGELEVLSDHIRDFVRGELRYLSSRPQEVWSRYLNPPPEWFSAAALTRSGARRLFRTALVARSAAPGMLRSAARHVAIAVGGPNAAVEAARAAAVLHRARVLALDGERQLRAYRQFWSACARWGRLEWIAANTGELARPRIARSALDIGGSAPPGAAGLYWPEKWGGRAFRWTEPVATIPLAANGAPVSFGAIELLPLRPPRELARLQVTVDGRPVRLERSSDCTSIHFEVRGPGVHWIGLACPPLAGACRAPGDRRRLATPLAALELEPR
jgi:hypothetical protein